MTLPASLWPDLDKLRAFERTAHYQSLTTAAAELNLSQSAVSRKVRDLELQYNVTLFDRIKQRVILTDFGREWLKQIKPLLSAAEKAAEYAGTYDRNTSLKIACIPTFCNEWVMPRIPKFLAKNPTIGVCLRCVVEPFSFGNDNFDAAIFHLGTDRIGVTAAPIFREELVLVGVDNEIIRDDIALRNAIESRPRLHHIHHPQAWEAWFRVAGWGHVTAPINHTFDQFNHIAQAAAQGAGLALVPRYLADRMEASKTAVLAEWSVDVGDYKFAIGQNSTRRAEANLFYKWMRDEIAS